MRPLIVVDVNSGNDENPGTQTLPFKTITHALSVVNGPDDDINIADGIYNITSGESFPLYMKPRVNLIGESHNVFIGDNNKQSIIYLQDNINYYSNTHIENLTLVSPIFMSTNFGIFSNNRMHSITIQNVKFQKFQNGSSASNANYINCIFENCRTGIGLYSGIVDQCLFVANDNAMAGTGIYGDGSNGTIRKCIFTGEQTGIILSGNNYNTSLSVDACKFYNNMTAIYVERCYNFYLKNSLVYENHVGALNFYVGTCYITNTTLVRNFNYAVQTTTYVHTSISNSIIRDNDFDFPSVLNILVTNSNLTDPAFLSSGGNINIVPQFINIANDDYHLAPNSPCINAGNPNTFGINETDLDGNPRVTNGRVDIGCYETPGRPFIYGDMNCDGTRNNFDIEPFIQALVFGQDACNNLNGDINNDGLFNNFDIDGFVNLLLN